MPYFQEYLTLPENRKEFETLVTKAKDFAQMHGACMRSKSNWNDDHLEFAPFTLLPSPFPRKEFDKAVKLQPILNKIIHRVAHDDDFLRKTLCATVEVDHFTQKLFEIYEEATRKNEKSSTPKQFISLGVFRSDFMLESSCARKEKFGLYFEHNLVKAEKTFRCLYCCLKQVEINTIAAGFGHMGPASHKIHDYVLKELECGEDHFAKLPSNNALTGICKALIRAWELYGNPEAVIVFIIEDVSYNICDQRFHEFKIREMSPKVKVLRKTLTQIHDEARLNDVNELLFRENIVSVVYYRAGYEPAHYMTANEWDAILLIELSMAIKCPSIQYHLAGTKKVQQGLANRETLKNYVDDEEELCLVISVFTGLYELNCEKESCNEILNLVMNHPDRYVLKPQREGGGNNVFGDDIPQKLKSLSEKERCAWVAMDRIVPPITKGYIIRPNDSIPIETSELVSELGIFGVIIVDTKTNNILVNEQVGHMFRTKLATADEGGVASGLGALDSPYLIE